MAVACPPQFGRHLECSICVETYSIYEHLPKSLPCGHTFCNICLENLYRNGGLECPNCKRQHTVPVEGVEGFPTNHVVTGMLDFSCGVCQNYGQTSRCPYCPLQICTACIEDHIQTDYNCYKPVVDASVDGNLDMIQNIKDNLPAFVDKVNTIINDCRTFCNKSKQVIQKRFTVDSLEQIEQKSSLYAETLRDVKNVLNLELNDIDPDLACFSELQSVVHKTKVSSREGFTVDSLEQMEQKSSLYAETLRDVNKVLNLELNDIDPDLACFSELQSVVRKTKVSSREGFTVDSLAQIEHKSLYAETLRDLNKVLNLEPNDIDPDLACFSELQTVVHNTKVSPRERFTVDSLEEIGHKSSRKQLSSTPKLWEPQSKPVVAATTDKEPLSYNNIPHLVFATKGQESPSSAAVDIYSGDIHVGDRLCKFIFVYDKDGRYKSVYNIGTFPRDLCFTSDGDVAITCVDNTVKIYDATGHRKKVIGKKKGKIYPHFDNPHGITTDHMGLLYLCDNQKIQVIEKFGSVVRVLGVNGPGQLKDPCSVAVYSKTGQVYVADNKQRQVNIYSHDGQYVCCIGADHIPAVSNFKPQYVSCRPDGLLCISDGNNDCIHLWRHGRYIQRIGKRGSAPGELKNPMGTTFTPSGEIIVSDMANRRVQIFSPQY